jgi:16S rRNA (guanine966-N2)-methyltransferase
MRAKHKKQTSAKSSGFIRIISGQWRGRKLPVKDMEGLRPTTDRVKETVFNWLMHDVAGAKCLDCFAGSGSLGFEALSRYAEQVTLLEKSPTVATQLSDNLIALKATNADIENTDTVSYLAKEGSPYNIVFIDPPFRKDLVNDTIQLLQSNGWLAENALIYLETEKELSDLDIPESWTLLKEKQAGQVLFRLFRN